jgi:hypothetical protein
MQAALPTQTLQVPVAVANAAVGHQHHHGGQPTMANAASQMTPVIPSHIITADGHVETVSDAPVLKRARLVEAATANVSSASAGTTTAGLGSFIKDESAGEVRYVITLSVTRPPPLPTALVINCFYPERSSVLLSTLCSTENN